MVGRCRGPQPHLPGFVVQGQFAGAPALRGGVFGVAVVVVEPGAVRQHSVGPGHGRIRHTCACIKLSVSGVERQPLHLESPQVRSRGLIAGIPPAKDFARGRFHELPGVFDLVMNGATFETQAVLGIKSGKNRSHTFCLRRAAYRRTRKPPLTAGRGSHPCGGRGTCPERR